MPISLGTIVGGIAKNYVKNQIKNMAYRAITRAFNAGSSLPYRADRYTVYHSDAEANYAVNNFIRRNNAITRGIKLSRGRNIGQVLNSTKGINKNLKGIERNNLKEQRYYERQNKFYLNSFDKGIFIFSQQSNRNGRFTIDDLKKPENARFLSQIVRNISRNDKEFKFGRYDANIIFKSFNKDNKITLQELKVKVFDKFKTAEDAEKQYNTILRRLNKLEKNGFVTYDEKLSQYTITSHGVDEYSKFKRGFEFTSYDANVIFGYIEKNDGRLTPEDLKKHLSEEFKERSLEDQFEYISRRIEKNIEHGYIARQNGGFVITEKGFNASVDISRQNFEAIQNRLDILEKIGFVNQKIDGTIEVTRDLYFQLSSRNMFDDKIKEINAVQDKELKIGYADRNIFRMIEQNKGVVNEDIVRMKYMDNEDKFKMTMARIHKLERAGYLEKTEKGFIKTDLGKEKISEFIRTLSPGQRNIYLNSFDKALYEFANKTSSPGQFTTEDLLTKDNEKLIKLINENTRKSKDFEFSKFDANVILKQFNKDKKITVDELKDKLSKIYKSDKESLKQFNIYSKRLDKLVKHEYVSFNKDLNQYSITSSGINKIKEVNKSFEFTSYDANVIFGYIDKNQGSLTFEDLRLLLSKEYKGAAVEDQFKYISQRIEKNIKSGYLDLSGNTITISDKGNNAAAELTKESLNRLQERLDSLVESGLLVKKSEELFKITDDFTELITASEAKEISKSINDSKEIQNIGFKFTNFDSHIYNMLEEKPFELEEKIRSIKEKYIDNEKESNRQIKMLQVRLNKLQNEGFIRLGTDNKYYITDAWIDVKNKLDNIKVEPQKFIFNKYDVDVLFNLFKSDQLSLDDLKNELTSKYKDIKKVDDELKIILGRLRKNVQEGNIEFLKNGNLYKITPKGKDEARRFIELRNELKKSKVKGREEIREIAKNFILRKDREQHILDYHTGKIKDPNYAKTSFLPTCDYKKYIKDALKDEKSIIRNNKDERVGGYCFYKAYDSPIGYSNTGEKLYTLKVTLRANGEVWTAYPTRESIQDFSAFNFTQFDTKHIIDVAKNGIWRKELFIDKNKELSPEELQNKLFSIESRLQNLLNSNSIIDMGNGEYELTDFFIERCQLLKEKGLNRLSKEQRQILMDLKNFYNVTDKQVKDFIYSEDVVGFAPRDLDFLVNRGYLGVDSRDIDGNGEYANIYYLTSEGKKAVSHMTGVEVKDIFSSKLHNRPEELRHDIYVYSAWKDTERRLISNGYKIENVFTDKDLRSLVAKDQIQLIEYPDLCVEFTDIRTGEKGVANIEVDCGYKPNVIMSKNNNIDNLVWYTNSTEQAEKIQKYAPGSKTIVLQL